jgi:hypothetical protein
VFDCDYPMTGLTQVRRVVRACDDPPRRVHFTAIRIVTLTRPFIRVRRATVEGRVTENRFRKVRIRAVASKVIAWANADRFAGIQDVRK